MAKKTIARKNSDNFKWTVPEKLNVPADPLQARLDFHNQACVLTVYDEINETRVVSALDVAQALAKELAFTSPLLPPHTLWWANTDSGPATALYEAPRIRKVALQTDAMKPPQRYTIPLPGLIFIVVPGKAPWVYAVEKYPQSVTDPVFAAPLCNVFAAGNTCPGNQKYSNDPAQIVETFFLSFFTRAANLDKRSKKFPQDVSKLWKFLDGKKEFPLNDMIRQGTVKDLMSLR